MFQVNSATDHTIQHHPSVTGLTDGGFVVVWQYSSAGDEIYGQRYTSSGIRLGEEFEITDYGTGPHMFGAKKPSITALKDGGFVVTWYGSPGTIWGQCYDNNGAESGEMFEVPDVRGIRERNPSIAALNDGGFVITWESERAGKVRKEIYGQRYDSNGEKSSEMFRINSNTYGDQREPTIAALADGGFVVTWRSAHQNFGGIYGQRYDSNGIRSGGEFLINSNINGDRYGSSVAGLADGGFIVTWPSAQEDRGNIYGQRYDSSGAKFGGEFLVNSYTSGRQMASSVVGLADGGFIVTWSSDKQADEPSSAIYAQRYYADGTPYKVTTVEPTLKGTDGDDNLIGTPQQDLISGLAGNDTITGLASDDLLLGDGGNDYLDGGIGNDVMAGGSGKDIFTFSTVLADNNIDTIMDFIPGKDKLQLDRAIFTELAEMENFAASSFIANGEGIAINGYNYLIYNTVTGALYYDADGNGESAAVQFAVFDNRAAITADDIILTGEFIEEPQEIIGTDGDDLLIGTADIDTIRGLAGNDTLNGLTGADSLFGGEGDDLYLIDDNTDILVENAGEGNDSVESEVSYTLGANLENLILTGTTVNGLGNELSNMLVGNEQNNTLNGFAGDDTIDGGIGADIMIGGDGNDLYIVDNAADMVEESIEGVAEGNDTVQSSVNYTLGYDIENLILIGEAIEGSGNFLDNTITGNDRDNIINGDAGADTMAGGLGDDLYLVDSDADLVVEDVAAGDDTVESSAEGYALGANIENLILAEGAVVGIGNELDNTIIGNEEDNAINGSTGADTIIGGAGADIVIFTDAVTSGINTIMDFAPAEDKIQLERSIFTSLAGMESLAPASFTANAEGAAMDEDDYLIYNTSTGALFYDADGSGEGAAVQFAQLDNKAAITADDFILVGVIDDGGNDDAIIGTDGDDSLYGTNKADIIEGLAGDDMLRGYGGADLIDGGAGNDLAYGGDGDDTVNGGAGNDSLYGNNGADLLAGGDGDDFLFGGAGKDSLDGGDGNDGLYGGTGNDVISGGAGADMVQGGHGNDTLTGGADNDSLYGGSGSDSLDGGAGMDFLNGGGGADFLSGGAGNDTVMGGADNDILHGNEGDDLLTGQQGDDNLDGGEGNDLLIGGIGDDTLVGGSGMDILFGKEGNDLFVINGDSGDIDSIIDFASGDDHLQLSGEIFAGLAAGELGEELFAANATGSAMDADDRILYNTDTGALFYDADGNGEGAAVQLAIFTNKEDIQSTDILVA